MSGLGVPTPVTPIYSLITEPTDYTDHSCSNLIAFFQGPMPDYFSVTYKNLHGSESFDYWSRAWLNTGGANSSSENAHTGMIWITHIL